MHSESNGQQILNLVSHAIIPTAGLGTRMFPATKCLPKSLLPLGDEPLLQRILKEARSAGIRTVVLVTASASSTCDTNPYRALGTHSSDWPLIKALAPSDLELLQVEQLRPCGLGDAIRSAYTLLGDVPFSVLLPDVILEASKHSELAELIARFARSGSSQILVESVSDQEVSSRGIVSLACNPCSQLFPGEANVIQHLIEKPAPEKVQSRLAVVGRYVFSATIWRYLKDLQPDRQGELQLTDAIAQLVSNEPVEAVHSRHRSYDCGSKLGYMQAFIAYGLRHRQLGKPFRAYIEELLSETSEC